jgi:hypothetical protein
MLTPLFFTVRAAATLSRPPYLVDNDTKRCMIAEHPFHHGFLLINVGDFQSSCVPDTRTQNCSVSDNITGFVDNTNIRVLGRQPHDIAQNGAFTST